MFRELIHILTKRKKGKTCLERGTLSYTKRFKPGEILVQRYKVDSLLGWGAMGYVLKARDLETNSDVALKFLYSFRRVNEPVTFQRFQNEFQIMQDFEHPNIVNVLRYEVIDDHTHCIVMEFINGSNLHDVLVKKHLSVRRVCDVAIQMTSALSYAHKKGIVHRDLKPENVLILRDGTVKIADFGIAKLLEDDRGLTKTGEGIGTAAYMSPEQFVTSEEKARATIQGDIYSFGIILFEMIEGDPPFEFREYVDYFRAHNSGLEPKFSFLTRAPLWYRDMVQKCLKKEPKERFQAVNEVRAIIERNTRSSAVLTVIKVVAFAALAYLVFTFFSVTE